MPVYYVAESQNYKVSMTIRTACGKDRKLTKSGFPSRSEAEIWEKKRNEKNDVSNLTLSFYANERYLPLLKKNVSEEAYLSKQIIFRKHIIPFLGNRKVSELVKEDIKEWHEWLKKQKDRNGKPLKRSYLASVHSTLSAALNAAESGLVPRGNVAKACGNFTTSGRKLRWWTVEEFRKFDALVKNPSLKALYRLLFWTGIKEGEALALTRRDFNEDNGSLYIHSTLKRRKGAVAVAESSQIAKRSIQLPLFLSEMLKQLTQDMNEEERIFSSISKTTLLRTFSRTSVSAGLKKITVNDLRTSNVKLLANMGVSVIDISRQLGNTPSNIIRYYAPFFSDNGLSIAKRLNELY